MTVTFTPRERLWRIVWRVSWLLLASWTPRPLNGCRLVLLRAFGARLAPGVVVDGSVRIWWPGNLEMRAGATLGPRSVCYNLAPVWLGENALVSQDAQLCTGTHDIDRPGFALIARPITVGARAWVASSAFVGPGVVIGEGAVLGACGVAFTNIPPETVWIGNPARLLRARRRGNEPGGTA